MNTAIVITLIFPFTATINGKLIPQIEALFFAEIVTSTVIQLLDPAGHFERHILAPRAPTQDAMNLKMQGSLIELAERYTNMTKMYVVPVASIAHLTFVCQFVSCALVLCHLSGRTGAVLHCTFYQLLCRSLLVDADLEETEHVRNSNVRNVPPILYLFSARGYGRRFKLLLGQFPLR